ncbi:MAG: hypothetical protein HFJ79_07345 [Clostridiales bacterium]|nr:hypothetical protein [Clostridiales bacterium]
MFLKIVPALFFILYYRMCTRSDFQPFYRYIQSVIFIITGLTVGFQLGYAKYRDIFDEFAKENLKRADSLCLKAAFVFMIILAVICILPDFSGKIAGYYIVISIFLLSVLRAVIFYQQDKKGI